MTISEAELARVADVLDALGGLDALWVFGSEASGTAAPTSDVDLAALFTSRPSPPALLVARGDLEALLGRAVDLVDLERASPLLAMQVVRHGHLLSDRAPSHRLRFLTSLPGRYEDVVRLRRAGERLLLSRLQHGRT